MKYMLILLTFLSSPTFADKGWYALVGGGSADYDTLNSDSSWHIGAGYHMTPFLAAEVVYHDLGKVSETSASSVIVGGVVTSTTMTASGDVRGVETSVVLSYPAHRWFEPFLKAGFFSALTDWSLRHIDVGGNPVFTSSDESKQPTGIVGIGAHFGPVVVQYGVIQKVGLWNGDVRVSNVGLSYRHHF